MTLLNKISIFPTARCGHECEYCLLDHHKVLPKKQISDKMLFTRLDIILKIIKENHSTSQVEFLLGDDPQNLAKEVFDLINDFSKNKTISITMNNVDIKNSNLPFYTFKHALSIDELLQNPLENKIFIVTEENIKFLTQEIINKCIFTTTFAIDTCIQDITIKNSLVKRLNDFNVNPAFKSICLNTYENIDIFVDSGLITFSCSKKITHIIGHVDFENKKFVITKTHCDKNCKLI